MAFGWYSGINYTSSFSRTYLYSRLLSQVRYRTVPRVARRNAYLELMPGMWVRVEALRLLAAAQCAGLGDWRAPVILHCPSRALRVGVREPAARGAVAARRAIVGHVARVPFAFVSTRPLIALE